MGTQLINGVHYLMTMIFIFVIFYLARFIYKFYLAFMRKWRGIDVYTDNPLQMDGNELFTLGIALSFFLTYIIYLIN